eukprot:scaffold5364_cov164-Amphora_coffeaeformis.AAC.9
MAKTGRAKLAPVDDEDDSSSSYDSLSSDDEVVEEEHSRPLKIEKKRPRAVESDGDEEQAASSSSEDDEDDDDDDDIEEVRKVSLRDDNIKNECDSSSSSSSSSSDSNDDDSDDSSGDEMQSAVLLEQRLRQSTTTDETARQSATQAARQRKKEAKELASKRLAALRASKVEQPPPTNQKTKKKKICKHRPTEASSKRADFYNNRASLNESGIGIELGAHKYKPNDPRGSNLVGHFNEEQFSHNYLFVRELQQQEMAQLKKRIAARQVTGRLGQKKRRALGITGEGSLEEDKARLKELKQKFADEERHRIDVAAQRAVKKQLREKSAVIGKPVYAKRSELKRMTYEAKLDEVRKRRGEKAVEKIVTKRRKRIKSRDAKRLAGGHGLP